jgi:hypothetical protein
MSLLAHWLVVEDMGTRNEMLPKMIQYPVQKTFKKCNDVTDAFKLHALRLPTTIQIDLWHRINYNDYLTSNEMS